MTLRRGFVLAIALVVVVLAAILVTAAMFASNQESSVTASGILDQQASAYAERIAYAAIADWDCAACDLLTVGGVIIQTAPNDPPLEGTVYVTRLDSALFLVTAEGRVVASSGTRLRRRISVAVKTARDATGVSRASRLSEHAWSAVYRM